MNVEADRADTMEQRSDRVRASAITLAGDLDDFLLPPILKDASSAPPNLPLPAIDQIMKDLEETESALQIAAEAFAKIKARIR